MNKLLTLASLALVLALGAPVAATNIPPEDDDADTVLSFAPQNSFTADIEKALYDLVVAENETYSNGKCNSFGTRITRINSAARWHAKDMGVRGYFGHSIPQTTVNGVTVDNWADLDLAFEYHPEPDTLQGQNIAVTGGLSGWTAQQYADYIFGGWMGSTGHRANIRNCNWTVMGMGVWRDTDDPNPNLYYSVNIFMDAMKEEVTDGSGVWVRTCSDTSCTGRFVADLGRKTFVIEGPEPGDGYTWDYVKVKGEDPAYGWIRDDKTTGDQEAADQN